VGDGGDTCTPVKLAGMRTPPEIGGEDSDEVSCKITEAEIYKPNRRFCGAAIEKLSMLRAMHDGALRPA